VGNTSASFRTGRPGDIDPGAFRWLGTAVCTVVLISDDIVFIDEQRLDSSFAITRSDQRHARV
jgi:hypothetical protein